MTIKWIDGKLTEWGKFMRDNNNLGYPTSSIESRMQDGCFGGGSMQPSDGYVPSDIEKTERAVLILPHEEQAVINVAYMTGGTRTDQATRLSRRLNRRFSRDGFNKILDRSHTRLDGIFIGMKINKDHW